MNDYIKNQNFHELCALGDESLVREFFSKESPDVNSKNKMNGWTALHWACKRNHVSVVRYLLEIGASIDLTNNDGKIAGYYSTNQEIRRLFNLDQNESTNNNREFKPSYLANPEFFYSNNHLYSTLSTEPIPPAKISKPSTDSNDLLRSNKVKVKANTDEDFVEFDLDKLNITFDEFKLMCLKELERSDKESKITKIRKLPNTLIRNENDLKRLKNEQEIEIFF